MKPCTRDLQQSARIFKALSHPQRLRLACQLLEADCPSQKQLVLELGLPQSSVARLLEPLRQCGLVVGERDGAELHISVQSQLLGPMLDLIREWQREQAARALDPELPSPRPSGKPSVVRSEGLPHKRIRRAAGQPRGGRASP